MTRDVYVEDLVPGDRISLEGTPRVVRTTSRLENNQLRIELVKGTTSTRSCWTAPSSSR
ncbi:hypothetical protein GORBP_097_00505 [Gordonia rubripertincta NBRC 101908]|uniref:Uncharacterized protein n=1 Tax=Gordonia rubripertincta NBRC 101908 TaxID=1077975 RepID=A0ABQ0HY94_GORRU|nr:hypothetical protein GORBP_097_00505 [Gordonia rubripertincta NBRC 101908]